MLEQQTKQRKKTGPKPLYGEAKKMVSFRLSPEALAIIKGIADKHQFSQAEVIEQWARKYRDLDLNVGSSAPSTAAITENRELVGAQRTI